MNKKSHRGHREGLSGPSEQSVLRGTWAFRKGAHVTAGARQHLPTSPSGSVTPPGLQDGGGNLPRVFKHHDGFLNILGRLAAGLAPSGEDGKKQKI